MEERILGRTERLVSVVGLGTWQLGADWGDVSEADAFAVLDAAALVYAARAEGARALVIAAGAGTGKTWTIAALYLRLVLGHGDHGGRPAQPLGPSQILVMTFTRAATRELSDRIRARLIEAAQCFRGAAEPAPFHAPNHGQHTGTPPRMAAGSGSACGESHNTSRWPAGRHDSRCAPCSATMALPWRVVSSRASWPACCRRVIWAGSCMA